MKTRQVVSGLVGIIGLVIAFQVGRYLQTPPSPTHNPNDRFVTISASPPPDAGKCELDYPVAFLRQHGHIQWASTGNKYWVSFLTVGPPPPNYTPENPLVPADDPVIVDANGSSRMYNVKPKTKYYMYAIFDHDPTTNPNNPCKEATEDHDPGLNVKP